MGGRPIPGQPATWKCPECGWTMYVAPDGTILEHGRKCSAVGKNVSEFGLPAPCDDVDAIADRIIQSEDLKRIVMEGESMPEEEADRIVEEIRASCGQPCECGAREAAVGLIEDQRKAGAINWELLSRLESALSTPCPCEQAVRSRDEELQRVYELVHHWGGESRQLERENADLRAELAATREKLAEAEERRDDYLTQREQWRDEAKEAQGKLAGAVEALRKLRNEAASFLSQADELDHGVTNMRVFRSRIEEADAVLAKQEGK